MDWSQIWSGIIGGFIGALGGAYFTYLFAVKLQSKQQKREAATEFKTAFTDAIYDLQEGRKKAYEIFTESIVFHAKTLLRLWLFLDETEAKKLDEAWQEYRNQPDQYLSAGSIDKEKQYKALMLERIEKLQSLADPK